MFSDKSSKLELKHLSAVRQARILRFIDLRISCPIRLNELAAIAALSPFHFAREFKATTGVTPMRFVLERRIAHSKVLLMAGITGATVALECGFSSQSHFCTSFFAVAGFTPGRWKKLEAMQQAAE